jgi:integrase/recombinase XerD
MTPLRRRMIEDMTRRNLAPKTIESYVQRVAEFARYFKTSPERLGPDHVRTYLPDLVQERRLSCSHYNQIRSAFRFRYLVTLNRDSVVRDIACAKKPHSLPVVLSLVELTRSFRAITNLKHRVILMTTYAAGLRVSEITSLRVADIDGQRMVTRVPRQGVQGSLRDAFREAVGGAARVLENRSASQLLVYRGPAGPADFDGHCAAGLPRGTRRRRFG